MEFHEKIQELRKRKGLTQEELAAALYVSRTAVSKWESGRGYPNIDSLKAIAKFFSVTIDELLSGDELLTIAEEDTRQREAHFLDLAFGLTDCAAAMLLFLPFFAQAAEGAIQASNLLFLGGIAPWLKAVYLAAVTGTALWGILALAMQNCRRKLWAENRQRVSLLLNAAGVLLFIMGRQPYAAAFLFVLLAIKALLLIKRR